MYVTWRKVHVYKEKQKFKLQVTLHYDFLSQAKMSSSPLKRKDKLFVLYVTY